MKTTIILMVGALFLLSSCRMFTAWRTIPAPDGCAECHKVPISTNWQIAYKPVTLNDEKGGASFQSPQSLQPRVDKPSSQFEKQKVEGLACFECHNSPDSRHKTMKGNFHH